MAWRTAVSILCSCLLAIESSQYVNDVWRLKANTAMTSKADLKGTFVHAQKRQWGVFIGDMTMYVSHPDRSEKLQTTPEKHYPVVIIAHHAVGIYHATFLREFADSLAKEGYIAVLPDFFHRVWSDDIHTGMNESFEVMNIPALLQSLHDENIKEDLESALHFISQKAHEWKADPQRVGVVGFCMGGRIAWLAGVSREFAGRVRGIVPYHGGNAFKTWPDGHDGAQAPGDQLSHLHCPVLGHFGKEDQNPSQEDMGKLQTLSQASGQNIEFHSYEGAKHGFSCRDSSNYLSSAAETAWPRTLHFFAKSLAKGAAVPAASKPVEAPVESPAEAPAEAPDEEAAEATSTQADL